MEKHRSLDCKEVDECTEHVFDCVKRQGIKLGDTKGPKLKVSLRWLVAGSPSFAEEAEKVQACDVLNKEIGAAFKTLAQSFQKRVRIMLDALAPGRRDDRDNVLSALFDQMQKALDTGVVQDLQKEQREQAAKQEEQSEAWNAFIYHDERRPVGRALPVDVTVEPCTEVNERQEALDLINLCMAKVASADVMNSDDLNDATLHVKIALDRRTDADRAEPKGRRAGAAIATRQLGTNGLHIEALGGKGLGVPLVRHELSEARKSGVTFVTLDCFTDGHWADTEFAPHFRKTTDFWRSMGFDVLTQQDAIRILCSRGSTREKACQVVKKAVKATDLGLKAQFGLKKEEARLLPMVLFFV